MTAAEAAQKIGCSISWLRSHECGWCAQTGLNAMRYGCCAIGEKCDPEKNIRAAFLQSVTNEMIEAER